MKLVFDAGAADSPEPMLMANLTIDDNEGILREDQSGGITTGLHIRYKALYISAIASRFLGRQILDMDSIRWALFKKALKK